MGSGLGLGCMVRLSRGLGRCWRGKVDTGGCSMGAEDEVRIGVRPSILRRDVYMEGITRCSIKAGIWEINGKTASHRSTVHENLY